MIALMLLGLVAGGGEDPVKFEVKVLAVDANEGCAIADFDGDGKPDVVAGRNWYRNGDWLPRPVRLIEDVHGYVTSNGDHVFDVNGDGRPDVIAGGYFEGGVAWYENPGKDLLHQGFLWPRHELVDTKLKTNEIAMLHDLDGDGTPEWVVNEWNAKAPLMAWRLVKGGKGGPALKGHVIGKRNGHGIGFGDLNGDGRGDILVATGWYEQPEGDPYAGEWPFHADWNGRFSCPVLIRDVDGDGKGDIVWGNPHDYGVFLWLGKGKGADGKLAFEEKTVDRSYSQAHCLAFADLDGDGTDEVVTGKRVRAHNGKDPGGKEPPVMAYYAWDAKARTYVPHEIVKGTVGIGLQVRAADLDGDGDVDLVVAGKEGTQILFNRSK